MCSGARRAEARPQPPSACEQPDRDPSSVCEGRAESVGWDERAGALPQADTIVRSRLLPVATACHKLGDSDRQPYPAAAGCSAVFSSKMPVKYAATESVSPNSARTPT
jgi:hypothetical protein